MLVNESIFIPEVLETSIGNEEIIRGGRPKFCLLHDAFEGIETIVVVGWGSQAPAQAQNLRDTLTEIGSSIAVKVALRPNSEKFPAVRNAGFSEENGTLGIIDDLVPQADLLLLLISDGGQTEQWEHIVRMMKPGSTLGLSHGFLHGYLRLQGRIFRPDINVILMAPKGMGDSLRRLYLQESGINASVAVEQTFPSSDLVTQSRVKDLAVGWAIAVGAPVVFFTSMRLEYVSDLTGERGMLLGMVWGMVEALYEYFRIGHSGRDAFLLSVRGLTSTIAQGISASGLLGFYHTLSDDEKQDFKKGYVSSYKPAKEITKEIYAAVTSGKEIEEVIQATRNLHHSPLSTIDMAEMWNVATRENLYGPGVAPKMSRELAFVAGMYVGGLMAGISYLVQQKHSVSEAVNEQLIEAIDSLLPYLDRKGIRHMVDNCSMTARIGTRKWGPIARERFLHILRMDYGGDEGRTFEAFLHNQLHDDIAKIFKLRPQSRLVL